MKKAACLLFLLPALLLAACGGGTTGDPGGTSTTPTPTTATFSLTVTVDGASSAPIRITRTTDNVLVDQETVTGHVTITLPVGSYLVEGLASGAYPAAVSQTVQGSANQTLNTTLSYALAKATTLSVSPGDGLPVSAGTTTTLPFTLTLGNPNDFSGKVTFTGQNLPAGVTVTPFTQTYPTTINTTETGSVQVAVAAGTAPSVISGTLQAANAAGATVSTPFKLFVQPASTYLGPLETSPPFVPAQQGDWLAYFNEAYPSGKLFQVGGTTATFQFPTNSPHTLIGSPSGNALVFGTPASSTDVVPISVARSDGTVTNYTRPQSQYPASSYPAAESDDSYWQLYQMPGGYNNNQYGPFVLQRWSLSGAAVTASQKIDTRVTAADLRSSTDGQWMVIYDYNSLAAFRLHVTDLKFESVRSGSNHTTEAVISNQGQACFFGTYPTYPSFSCTDVGAKSGFGKEVSSDFQLIGFDAQVPSGLWVSIGNLVERIDSFTGKVDVAVQYASKEGTLGIIARPGLISGLDVIERRTYTSSPGTTNGLFYLSHLP